MRDMFFMDSKGDVSRVFQACVLHASSTNLAAVRGFRRRFSKAMCRDRHVFFLGFKGDVPRVFLACVLHASGTNLLLFEAFGGGFPRPCAVRDMFFFYGFQRGRSESFSGLCFVRGFRRRFSKAMCRERHVFYAFQR